MKEKVITMFLTALGVLVGFGLIEIYSKPDEASHAQELEHLREENKDLKSQNKVYKEMTLRIMEKFEIKK